MDSGGATAIDLTMDYYTIKFDLDANKICATILCMGSYTYKWLPMDKAGSPDIFQSKISDLMNVLVYLTMYL